MEVGSEEDQQCLAGRGGHYSFFAQRKANCSGRGGRAASMGKEGAAELQG